MDPSMVPPFLWNMLAWLAWGLLILALRYHVERQQQKYAAQDAQAALNNFN
jgi:heme exporter protein C